MLHVCNQWITCNSKSISANIHINPLFFSLLFLQFYRPAICAGPLIIYIPKVLLKSSISFYQTLFSKTSHEKAVLPYVFLKVRLKCAVYHLYIYCEVPCFFVYFFCYFFIYSFLPISSGKFTQHLRM